MDFNLLLVGDDRDLLRLMERNLQKDYPDWITSKVISAQDALSSIRMEQWCVQIFRKRRSSHGGRVRRICRNHPHNSRVDFCSLWQFECTPAPETRMVEKGNS